jgi:DNA-directed RNA polymerase subunit RPC12/RpoP
MEEKKYKVELLYNELLLLDGHINDETQKIIDTAKVEHSIGFELPFMNEVIVSSLKRGTLKWTFKEIRSCPFCDKKYNYYVYPRSGRYHRKGDINHNAPKYYSGIAFNEGFITIKGCGDICQECAKKYNVIEKLCKYIIEKDLPIEIQKNNFYETQYRKDNIKICYECKKEMQESMMGKLPALMQGEYPGKCPHCGAKSLLFGKSHEVTSKFVMIKVG